MTWQARLSREHEAIVKTKASLSFSCYFLLTLVPLLADPDFKLETPHPELYREPKVPVGTLGLPLGTFVVLDGYQYQGGKGQGPHGFSIEGVNGKRPDGELGIWTEWPNSLPVHNNPEHHYRLHGYETAGWYGSTPNLPKSEIWVVQLVFGYMSNFKVTSVETIDGKTVEGAKPLNPKVPLVEPKFVKQLSPYEIKPPIGKLGLPLGTFAIIQAHAPKQLLLMESPLEVIVVNGKKLDLPVIISVPNVDAPKGDTTITLHGFEAGEWASSPVLPKSENPSGTLAQQPFQFYHRFELTSPVKAGD
jgi:hypothetical protein